MHKFLTVALLSGLAGLALPSQEADAFFLFRPRNQVNVQVNNGFAGARGNVNVNVANRGFFRRDNVNVNVGVGNGFNSFRFNNFNRFNGFNHFNSFNRFQSFGYGGYGFNRVLVGSYAAPVALVGYSGCDVAAVRSYTYGLPTVTQSNVVSEEVVTTNADGSTVRTFRQFR